MIQSGHFASASGDHDELAMLRAMLDHLPVGICLFDRELRLLAINRLLVQMLDFPWRMFEDSLPTLEELTLFNALRGEYGPGDPQQQTQVRMALARKGEAHRFQRARPNGQVLEIMGAPLPSGGFISIYTDITEHLQTETALREQALYLHSVVDHLPQGITVFDEQLRLKCWNATVLDVLELPPESAYADVSFDSLLMYPALRGEYGPGDPREQVAQRRAMALEFKAHRFERTRPTGRTHLVEGRPMQMDGRTVGFVTSYTDITENKQRESALAEKTALLQTLVDNLPSGVSIYDRHLQLVLINQQAIDLLGFTAEVLQQHPDFAGLVRWNAERGEYGAVDVERFVAEMVEKAAHPVAHQLVRTRPHGTILEIRGQPLADGGFITIYTDVSEQHRAAEAIERLAHRDTLTGLANRYTLEAQLDQLVADARRHDRRLAVMFLDMDNFKAINDTLGHGIGDQFLCEVARRLQATVRDNDIVARLGGDEFVVVLTELLDPADATTVANKIIAALNQPIALGSHVLCASASIGICYYPQDGRDRGTLMQSADIAMYHAKNAGKGVFHCFNAAMRASARTA